MTGFSVDDLGCRSELLAGLELALGVDDLGPLLALGLGLPRHRPLHRLRQLDILDLDHADLDAPRLGLLVDDHLQLLVDLLALAQQLIQVRLAEHDRSVVCAIWEVARMKSATLTTAACGSMTRK